GVDEWAAAVLKFRGDIVAHVSTSVSVNQENAVRIFGSEGSIHLPNPWVANRTAPDRGRIIVHRKGEKERREIIVEAEFTSYAYEADAFGRALLSGARQASPPAMSWADSMGNMRTLDRWCEAIGLTYGSEKPAGFRETTIQGRPLSPRPDHTMKYGR